MKTGAGGGAGGLPPDAAAPKTGHCNQPEHIAERIGRPLSRESARVLDTSILVTWYGNPWSAVIIYQ